MEPLIELTLLILSFIDLFLFFAQNPQIPKYVKILFIFSILPFMGAKTNGYWLAALPSTIVDSRHWGAAAGGAPICFDSYGYGKVVPIPKQEHLVNGSSSEAPVFLRLVCFFYEYTQNVESSGF